MQNNQSNEVGISEIQKFQSALDTLSGKTFRFEYSPDSGLNLYPKNPDNVPIGGRGITRRNWKQLEDNFDSSLGSAIEEASSIIIFGNGLSLVPLEIKDKYPLKKIAIVDMLDYYELALKYIDNPDLILSITGSYPRYASDLVSFFKNAVEIVNAEQVSNLQIFHHALGLEQQIDMGMYDLGINCYGPPANTLNEQLKSIAPNGYILFKPDRSPFQVIRKSR